MIIFVQLPNRRFLETVNNCAVAFTILGGSAMLGSCTLCFCGDLMSRKQIDHYILWW